MIGLMGLNARQIDSESFFVIKLVSFVVKYRVKMNYNFNLIMWRLKKWTTLLSSTQTGYKHVGSHPNKHKQSGVMLLIY